MRRLFAVALLLVLPGCYHAVVTTGRPASTTVINKAFQPSFFWGLKAPEPLDVSRDCPQGVAKFETIHTFVEGLITVITAGIFTPFSTIVTCASGDRVGALPEGSVIQLPEGYTAEQRLAAFNQAAALAGSTGLPAYVRF